MKNDNHTSTRKRNASASNADGADHSFDVSPVKKTRNSVVKTPPPANVTPVSMVPHKDTDLDDVENKSSARRALVMPVSPAPSSPATSSSESDGDIDSMPSKSRFGHKASDMIHIQENTRKVYKLIHRQTGAIGGNGSFGAIYGELTVGSMQKMIDLMKEHTEFTSSSRFIDVGSGLGKPSLHVAQDPGVEFSYGIEMERVRWMLGMSNLSQIVNAAHSQQRDGKPPNPACTVQHRCVFDHGNIMEANTFDPFTHVYMFSIGFPPKLWRKLSDMFNKSESLYLICYHAPRIIIDRYGFSVELLVQAPTSMHGSSEGHMGYIYRRKGFSSSRAYSSKTNKKKKIACDPVFEKAWRLVRSSVDEVKSFVDSQIHNQYSCGRRTRSSKIVMCVEPENNEK
mmetsp:Transcript_1588/g.2149  ORF Transcript_1588/g.2149 Transcript_1588/m.2149 type:complete len:397 (-) Transcript_1588:162-1352(-)